MTLQRSSRDPAQMQDRLTGWLAEVLPPGAEPEVVVHDGIQANGMSSETVLLAITSNEGGARTTREYVARVAPAAEDLPVFPAYRLTDQYDAMRLAGELAGVPVPPVGHNEPTGSVLGTPFFLMERLDGAVPPDVLPYTFGDNWLFDADPRQQELLQRSSVEVLAKLHGIPDAATTFAFLDPARTGHQGDTLVARNLLSPTHRILDYECQLQHLGQTTARVDETTAPAPGAGRRRRRAVPAPADRGPPRRVARSARRSPSSRFPDAR